MLIDFHEVSSAQQSFTANVFFLLSWRDDRLAHEGTAPVRRALAEVWNPRPQITNQQKLWTTFPEEVEISPGGLVSYRQRYYGQFSQPLDLSEFPFDRHSFRIELVTAGYSPEEVQLVQHAEVPSGLVPDLSLPDWKVTGWTAGGADFEPLPGHVVAGFGLAIEAKRYVGYYFFQVLMPLLLVLGMSWIVFWIDPTELGTRISVSVTSMLTLIAYRFMIGGLLPKISYLTRLDLIILGATLLVFATLLGAALTSTMAKHGKLEQARAIHKRARLFLPLIFGLIVTAAILG